MPEAEPAENRSRSALADPVLREAFQSKVKHSLHSSLAAASRRLFGRVLGIHASVGVSLHCASRARGRPVRALSP